MSGLWMPALGTALVRAAWQGLVIAGVAELVLRAIGAAAPRLRQRIAAGGLVLQAGAFVVAVALIVQGARAALTPAASPAMGDAPDPLLSAAMLRILGLLWVATLCAAGLRLAVGLAAVRRLVASAEPVRDRALLRAFREARRRMGVPRRMALLQTSALDSPVAVAGARPAVLVPTAFGRGLGREHIVAILAHEAEHVRRRDFAWGVVLRVLGLPVAFHPAAHWLNRRAAAAREEACDDAAVRACGALVYARALERLERARPRRVRLHLAPAAAPTLARIVRLVRPARLRPRPVAAVGVLGLVLLCTSGAASITGLAGHGAALVHGTLPLVTIQATDPAGAFTLALRAGRVVAATVGGAAVPRDRLVQHGDSVRILDAAGAPHVSVRVAPGGNGISWTARSRP